MPGINTMRVPDSRLRPNLAQGITGGVKKVSHPGAGFTLVELMIVVAVIGIVAALVLVESSQQRIERTTSNGRVAVVNALKEARQLAFSMGVPVAVDTRSAEKIELFVWNDANGDRQIDVPNIDQRYQDGFGEVGRWLWRLDFAAGGQKGGAVRLMAGAPPGQAEAPGCHRVGDPAPRRTFVVQPSGLVTATDGIPCAQVRLYVEHLESPAAWALVDMLPTGSLESFDGF